MIRVQLIGTHEQEMREDFQTAATAVFRTAMHRPRDGEPVMHNRMKIQALRIRFLRQQRGVRRPPH